MSLDPYFGRVTLLLPADGADQATSVTDAAGFNTITAVGSGKLSTGTKKFGTASLCCGEPASYFTTTDKTDLDFGSGDFTIECHLYCCDNGAQKDVPVFGQYTTFFLYGYRSAAAYGATYNMKCFLSSNNSSWDILNGGTFNYTFNHYQWYHIAVSRQGSSLRTFVDGVLTNTHTVSGTISAASAATWFIGSDGTSTTFGHVDNLRVTKWTARYTGDFTPPTEAFPTGGTVLLLNLNSSTPTDDCGLATVTKVGSPTYSTSVKKFGTGSVAFNGTTDYLTVPHSINFNLSGVDFTIEGWFNFSALPTFQVVQTLVSKRTSGASQNSFTLQFLNIDGITYLRWAVSADGANWLSAEFVRAAFTPTLSTWYHIAVARAGTTLKLFVDGVVVASATVATTIYGSTSALAIGATASGTEFFNGYIDDVRITKGVARYS